MNFSNLTILRGASWTIGTVIIGQMLRFVTNLALARLLAPELFGIMVIINSIRNGVALLSDVGIGQNIVHNSNAESPDFYNTAWTINLVRCLLLWGICIAAAGTVANFYKLKELSLLFPVATATFVFTGFTATSLPLLQKRMRFVRLNIFEIAYEAASSFAHVSLALVSPTVWALVGGNLVASAVRMVGSYFIYPRIWHRFVISPQYTWQIFNFGKWIFISGVVYFFSANFDRLYLGKIVPLELLGIYGIARTFADLLSMIAARVGNFIVFPLIAAAVYDTQRERLYEQVRAPRLIFLVLVAIVLSLFASVADLLISALYDHRYQAAGWMLPMLVLGAWFSTMCNLNESMLMGLGKPRYGAIGHLAKLCWLIIGLPLFYARDGVVGAVAVVAIGDLWRYGPIFAGQVRERFSFGSHDLFTTIAMFTLMMFWEWLRHLLGYGTSFGYVLSMFRGLN